MRGVSPIDLSQIVEYDDGSATLTIQINDEDYTITWHKGHVDRIRQHENDEN